MLVTLYTLLPIFTIIGLGAVAEYKRVLQKNTSAIINQFVYYFSLPILLFYIMAQVNIEDISWRPALGFVIGICISQALGGLISLSHGKNASTMAGLVASFPNAAFMGIPIVMLVFGNNLKAEIYAGIAALLPTINIVYTDTKLSMQQGKKHNLAGTIKYILRIMLHSPPLIGASLGFFISIFSIPLPDFINISAKMLGSIAAPCSLFCIGMSVAAQLGQWSQSVTPKSKGAKHKNYLLHSALLIIKLILCPLLVYICCYLLGSDTTASMVMVIIAAMPTAIVCYVIAEKHQTFTDECIIATVVNTILSCLSIPFIIALLQYNFS